MPTWWSKLWRTAAPAPEPLRAVPQTRRQKNYLAASGYGYEYFFEGWRPVGARREYHFTVSGDRRNWFSLQVVLPESAVQACEAAQARPMADNERYAIAKMALFDAFDNRENPSAMQAPVEITAELAAELLLRLGIE
jgi:hypothetical protein